MEIGVNDMLRIFCEAKEKNDYDIQVKIKLDAYTDSGDEIKDFDTNTVKDLVDDFAKDCFFNFNTDYHGNKNDGVLPILKEQLEENKKEYLAGLLQVLTFENYTLEDCFITLEGRLLTSTELHGNDMDRIELYLGGKDGIMAIEMPSSEYYDQTEEITLIADPSYDIEVSLI